VHNASYAVSEADNKASNLSSLVLPNLCSCESCQTSESFNRDYATVAESDVVSRKKDVVICRTATPAHPRVIYTRDLRRLLSIFLLVILSSSLLVPAFGSDSDDSSLPACCRRNGKHHCSMSMSHGSSESGPGFRANAKCPLFPQTIAAPAVFHAAVDGHPASGSFSNECSVLRVTADQPVLQTPRGHSHQKRGPPSSGRFV